MAARAMWKGTIELDSVSVPVKLYAAAVDRKVHFHMLHADDHERVRQRLVDPATGETVTKEQIRKAREVEPGVFVELSEEELAQTVPEPTRKVELSQFIPEQALEHVYYDRPYYLGPDGDGAAYAALVQALAKEQRVAIASWVMRGKRYVGALRAHGDHLVLNTLRTHDEVLDLSKLEAPAGRELDRRELGLAEQLVNTLSGSFDPTAFRDEHRDRVLALIDAKRRGKPVAHKRPPARKEPPSLEAALQSSLKQLRKVEPGSKTAERAKARHARSKTSTKERKSA